MSRRGKVLICFLAGAILASMLLAYFARPKPPRLELVSPRQEYPDYSESYPAESKLAKRLTRSYGLAMILVQSPYTERNVEALDAVRSWAKERFQDKPDFLRPIGPESMPESRHTAIGSVFYNLFTGIYYWLEEAVGEILRVRIDQFHSTKQYASFRTAYFDLFGLDNETAALLAKYQTEKAKRAIPVILWTSMWVLAALYALVRLVRAKSRFDTMRRLLGYAWLLGAGTYLLLACVDNQVSALVAAFVCACLGLFFTYPVVLTSRSDSDLPNFRKIYIGSNWVSLALWMTLSVAAIQILTWIRTGSAGAPDPVTLALSSLSGNFLHDPAREKRLVLQAVGIIWLAVSLWTITQLRGDVKAARETEESLASLKGPL